jgi:hypothetical protein
MHQTQILDLSSVFRNEKLAEHRHRQWFFLDKSCRKMSRIFSAVLMYVNKRKSVVMTSSVHSARSTIKQIPIKCYDITRLHVLLNRVISTVVISTIIALQLPNNNHKIHQSLNGNSDHNKNANRPLAPVHPSSKGHQPVTCRKSYYCHVFRTVLSGRFCSRRKLAACSLDIQLFKQIREGCRDTVESDIANVRERPSYQWIAFLAHVYSIQ